LFFTQSASSAFFSRGSRHYQSDRTLTTIRPICQRPAGKIVASYDRYQITLDAGCRPPLVKEPGNLISNIKSEPAEFSNNGKLVRG
jgi:hypothetical protein